MEAHFRLDYQGMLKEIRDITGWSDESIAKEVGCSANSVRRWRSGDSGPIGIYQREIINLHKRVKKEVSE